MRCARGAARARSARCSPLTAIQIYGFTHTLTTTLYKGGAQVVWIRNLRTTCCSQFDSNIYSEALHLHCLISTRL